MLVWRCKVQAKLVLRASILIELLTMLQIRKSAENEAKEIRIRFTSARHLALPISFSILALKYSANLHFSLPVIFLKYYKAPAYIAF